MSKIEKRFKIIKTNSRRSYETEGTLSELIEAFSYTLECGASWQHEKGNKKINKQPKSIKTLVTNLFNASNNSAANGWSGLSYEYVEIN